MVSKISARLLSTATAREVKRSRESATKKEKVPTASSKKADVPKHTTRNAAEDVVDGKEAANERNRGIEKRIAAVATAGLRPKEATRTRKEKTVGKKEYSRPAAVSKAVSNRDLTRSEPVNRRSRREPQSRTEESGGHSQGNNFDESRDDMNPENISRKVYLPLDTKSKHQKKPPHVVARSDPPMSKEKAANAFAERDQRRQRAKGRSSTLKTKKESVPSGDENKFQTPTKAALPGTTTTNRSSKSSEDDFVTRKNDQRKTENGSGLSAMNVVQCIDGGMKNPLSLACSSNSGLAPRFVARRIGSRSLFAASGSEFKTSEGTAGTKPETKVSMDDKRVRWNDEGEAAVQARRAKRLLNDKKFRTCKENKALDEEFLTLLSTSDRHELCAIINGICTDPNDKFTTVALSQRFPSTRDKVFHKLTTERLDELDMKTKFTLINILASHNNHNEVGKYMARLWFSIDQKNRGACERKLGLNVATLARKCCSKDLEAFPVSLWTGGKADFTCLASDTTKDLPPKVKRAGESAIDTLAGAVLSFFPQRGRGIKLIGSPIIDQLMGELGILDLKDEIDWQATQIEFADIASFVEEVARNIKLNPVLVAFGAAWTRLDTYSKQACLPERTEDMEADVRYAVGYCFLQYILCKMAINGPRASDIIGREGPQKRRGGSKRSESFLDRMLSMMKRKRDELDWKGWVTNSSERNIIHCLDTYMGSCAQPIKQGGEKADALLGRVKAPTMVGKNLFEEMCENIQQGYESNAEAGFELLVRPPGSREECDHMFGSDRVKEWTVKEKDSKVTKTGVLLYKAPFPRVWNNLFDAWSLASSSRHADSVDYFAMILPPVLCGLRDPDEEGLRLSSRFVCMHIHMHYVLCARADAKNFVTTATDFRSDLLTQLFGLVNQGAANEYRVRVENVVSTTGSFLFRAQDEASRISAQSLWAASKSAMHGVDGARKLPENVMEFLRRTQEVIAQWGEDFGLV